MKKRRPGTHPLIKQIEQSKREKKISNAEIAENLLMPERTLYRRFLDPRKFTVTELEALAKLFNWDRQTLERLLEVS